MQVPDPVSNRPDPEGGSTCADWPGRAARASRASFEVLSAPRIAHFEAVRGQRVQGEAQVLGHPDVVRILPGEPLQALHGALQLLQCFGTIAELCSTQANPT